MPYKMSSKTLQHKTQVISIKKNSIYGGERKTTLAALELNPG